MVAATREDGLMSVASGPYSMCHVIMRAWDNHFNILRSFSGPQRQQVVAADIFIITRGSDTVWRRPNSKRAAPTQT